MIAPLLKSALEPIVERHRRMRMLNHLTAWWAIISLAGIVLYATTEASPWWLILLGCGALFGALGLRAIVHGWEPDFREIARRIERGHPELHALLLTAVEQKPDSRTGKLHYLQQRIIADAVRVTRQHQWLDAISPWKWIGAVALQAAAVAAMFFVFRAVEVPRPKVVLTRAVAVVPSSVAVTPGDASVERGSSLVVLAKFQGLLPSGATLWMEPQNEAAQRVPLVKSLNDPVFGGAISEVKGDLKYRVEYAGHATRDFTVHVFDHPRLERADATLHFPEYTKLPEKTVPDTHRVSAVEGTKLDIAFQLNKPVKSAVLVSKEGEEVPLTVDPAKAVASLNGFDVKASRAYELRLTDADGRGNKLPAQFKIDVLPNRRPELKFAMPKGDRRVSPIEEITFRGQAWDDFGLARYGLTINVAGSGEKDVELGRDTKADERREFAHVLKLEDLGVKPDELLSWYLWAEDIGPDGKPRRTATDMYFGEVRPFDEIYRAGDSAQAEQQDRQQQQQGGGSGGQAQKLAATEKQIVTATWNLQRAEEANVTEKKPSDKYRKDEPVVRDSQNDLLTQMKTTAERITDPKSISLVENVTHEMQSAKDRLVEAEGSAEPLPAALAAEQLAYNALLKLSAHEYEVTRRQKNQQQKGQGQGQQANQRELDELEMKDEKQRYETQKEAAPAQNQQQREQLAILNRLKELAQRQQDINERLKELQAALQAAKSPQEKENLSQQLKRLREEEQQLLSDLDESRQRMEQSSQQSQLADERKKLEQTRNDAQQAAEAMERNAPSQALANGARTARQLQDIRDDFRKKSSGQFNDEMREMRSDARALAQNQEAIENKLKAETSQPERPTLADSDQQRQEIAQQLDKQKAQLSDVTEQMKRVSEQAEAVEPLLAKELYDTLRKTTQAGTGEKLENTKTLAERGINAQAQKIEKEARSEVEDLKAGVERAAESVLGNEAESLRQARDELDALAQQVNREARQAQPDAANPQGQKPNSNAEGGDKSQTAQNDRTGDANRDGARQPGGQREGQGDRTAENAPTGGTQRGQRGQRGEGNPQDGSPQNGQPGDQAQQDQTARNGAEPGSQNGGARGERKATAQGRGQLPGGGQPGGSPDEATPADQQDQQNQQNQQGQAGNRPGRGQTARNGRPGGNGAGRDPQQSADEARQPGERAGQQARGGGGQITTGADSPDGTRVAELNRREAAGAGGGGGGGGGAMTGGGFVEWSDRLRNVEEMLDSPDLRNEAARIREVAKGVRVEFKKHSVQPDWDMVKMRIGQPLVELRNRLSEELARRESKESLVPIDRDPVPPKYAERVRSYYEELGRGK